MRLVRSHKVTDRGMVLVVALLVVLALSILGVSVLFVTDTDAKLSRSYAGEVDALFAANAGLQVGLRNAMQDAMWDPKGIWGNSILAIGGPPEMDATNKPEGSLIDEDGSVTGVRGSVYYDLAALREDATCERCDAAQWAEETMAEPYDLPSPEALDWTTSRAGRGSLLPNGAGYRIRFMGIPEATTSPMTPFLPELLRVVSTGTSGTSTTGASGNLEDGVARASRQVMATFRVRDIGIWSNSFFAGGESSLVLQGGNLVRGSIHVLNQEGESAAVSFTGGGGIRNNYMGIDRLVAERIPAPPGEPHSLGAELRVRYGNVEIDGNSSTVGQAVDQDATAPFTTLGKGPLDGIYVGSAEYPSTFIGSGADNHYADVETEYDASGFGLPFPDYNAATYEDRCKEVWGSSGNLPAYQRYLKGLPTTGTMRGVYALDLSALGRDIELQADGASTLGEEVLAAKGAIVLANSDHPSPRRMPAGASDGFMDVLNITSSASGRSTIVGVFKHLPGSSLVQEGNTLTTCEYASAGGGNGFLFLPAGATVPAGADAQRIWDYVERNWRRYGYADFSDADVNTFLGRAAGSAPDAAIGPGPIIDGVADARFGRFLVQGVVYIENHDVTLGSIQPGANRRSSIAYMGRGSVAVGDSTGPKDADARIASDGYVLAYRQFPCVDALGLMSPDTIHVGGPSNPGQAGAMGAWYGAQKVQVDQNSHVVGALVTFNTSLGAKTGNANELTQVPALYRCLPPHMIGDWSFYVLKPISWSEH